jgi:hypothetical protein
MQLLFGRWSIPDKQEKEIKGPAVCKKEMRGLSMQKGGGKEVAR